MMTKRITIAVSVVAMLVGGLLVMPVMAQPGPDPLSKILAKLDQLLTAVGNSSEDLQGVTQNWDKALPANDPGGPCPNTSSRFTCVLGGAAVRDNQTGLVWEQAPAPSYHTWIQLGSGWGPSARQECTVRTTGGQKGWRLPSVHELNSLVDPTQQIPPLPPGHPFTLPSSPNHPNYWSATTNSDVSTTHEQDLVWLVSFEFPGGLVLSDRNTFQYGVWCVRGGAYVAQY